MGTQRCNGRQSRLSKLLSLVQKQLQKNFVAVFGQVDEFVKNIIFSYNFFRLDAVAAIAALHQHQPFKSYIGAEIPAPPPPPPHAAPPADPSSGGGGGSPYVTQHVRTSSGGILIKRSTAAAAASLPRTTAAYHDVSSGTMQAGALIHRP